MVIGCLAIVSAYFVRGSFTAYVRRGGLRTVVGGDYKWVSQFPPSPKFPAPRDCHVRSIRFAKIRRRTFFRRRRDFGVRRLRPCRRSGRARHPCDDLGQAAGPEQKQVYENFLGNEIAAHLKKLPGISVAQSRFPTRIKACRRNCSTIATC